MMGGRGSGKTYAGARWLAELAEGENLTLAGSAALGTGNALDNVLTGNTQANTLTGLAGDDTLNGGGAADTLIGGDGADHFLFNAASSGTDTISDFNALDGGAAEGDLLVFQGLLTGEFAYLGTDAFSGTGNTEARVRAGSTEVLVDTDGDGVVNIRFNLTGLADPLTELTVADFLFIA